MNRIITLIGLIYFATVLDAQSQDKKEEYGIHDNLHYVANYLEEEQDELDIMYHYDLCLCPKWVIIKTGEKIWIEGDLPNNSNYDYKDKKVTIKGKFYKYPGITPDVHSFNYLKSKDIPNARIFKLMPNLKVY